MTIPTEKFPPHRRRPEPDLAGEDKRQANGWRVEAAIGKLIAQVKENLAARGSAAAPPIENRIEAEKLAPHLNRPEAPRTETLASAVSGLIKGISRVRPGILPRRGMVAPGK